MAPNGRVMEHANPSTVRPDDIERSYRSTTTALIARRVPVAVGMFLFFIGVACVIEWISQPGRRAILLEMYVFYVGICALHLLAVRVAPSWTRLITVITTNALALSIAVYFCLARGDPGLCLIALAIYLTGLVVIYPWGLSGQALGGLGALIGFPVAVVIGSMSSELLVYELFALVTVVLLTDFGAHLIDRHRWEAFRHAVDLEHANAVQREEREFSTALLQVVRSLNAAISAPQALADRITEETRRALQADWCVLYTPRDRDNRLHATAIRGASRAVAEEIRGLGFDPAQLREVYRQLLETGTVEITAGRERGLVPPEVLARWQTRAALCQAVIRDGRLIGILACCYRVWGGPFTAAQRHLLAAIAEQAVVAIDNARLMEEARAANRIKSEFVSTVSHEVRTPLNVIVGYTDLLIDGVFGVPGREQLEALQRVRQQSTHLLELIQTMLDLNRLEAGRIPLLIESFQIDELFGHLRAGIPANWRKNDVQLVWQGDETTLIRSDRGKVEVILRNLIHNALKYTDSGVVTVEARPRPDDGGVNFAVTDTGLGISAGDLGTIFEMFRQGSNGAARGGGVGLGLYIVRRLTEALGGTIEVSSHPGAGTRFQVSLPPEPPRQ